MNAPSIAPAANVKVPVWSRQPSRRVHFLFCAGPMASPSQLYSISKSLARQTSPHWTLTVLIDDEMKSNGEDDALLRLYDPKTHFISSSGGSNSAQGFFEWVAMQSEDVFCPIVGDFPPAPDLVESILGTPTADLPSVFFCERVKNWNKHRRLGGDSVTEDLLAISSLFLQDGPSPDEWTAFLYAIQQKVEPGFGEDLDGKLQTPFCFHIDHPIQDLICDLPLCCRGWCFSLNDDPVQNIRVRCGDQFAFGRHPVERPDVAQAFAGTTGQLFSGFEIAIPTDFLLGRQKIFLEALHSNQWASFHELSFPPRAIAGWQLQRFFWDCFSRRRTSRLLQSPVPTPTPGLPPTVPSAESMVDVIIPVFAGYSETKTCLQSVLESRNVCLCEVVVINDASADRRICAYLDDLSTKGRIRLVKNTVNSGFVHSSNLGLALHSDRDAVLLNSDTMVTDYWLDRLRSTALSAPDIASVSPLSNNATICSVPKFLKENRVPAGWTPETLDQLLAELGSMPVEAPTTVGFCMYLRREALRQVGYLDSQLFGHGYGEENDFCLRASVAGFRHLVATNVFVFHAGSISFADSREPRVRKATGLLEHMFPGYERSIADFCQKDPLQPVRLRLLAEILRRTGRPVVLFISHNLGGGTEKNLQELAGYLQRTHLVLSLRPTGRRESYLIQCLHDTEILEETLTNEILVKFLQNLPLVKLHFHHTLGFGAEIFNLPKQLSKPYDFTVHDYFSYCPQVNLVTAEGVYCGEPDEDACNRCLTERPRPGIDSIESWRHHYRDFLEGARRVFCPTREVAKRMARHFPKVPLFVVPHLEENGFADKKVPLWRFKGGKLRIVCIGNVNLFKGARLIRDVAEQASQADSPIEIHLLGEDHSGLLRPSKALTMHGSYQDHALDAILERISPHLAWCTSVWPETYSYVLSAILRNGLPVAATDLGAYSERLQNHPLSILLPVSTSASDWLALFLSVQKEKTLPSMETTALPLPEAPFPSIGYEQYFEKDELSLPILPTQNRRSKKRIGLLVSSHGHGRPDPCAYIRLLLPLSRSEYFPDWEFVEIRFHHLQTMELDAIIVQRDALQFSVQVDCFIRECRRRSIPYLYEIDDMLLKMDEEHHEFGKYRTMSSSLQKLVENATLVTTTNHLMADGLLRWSQSVAVVPNARDDHLAPHLPPRFPEANRIGFLYMGTNTHRQDLDMLEEPFSRLRDKYPGRFFVSVIGIVDTPLGDWYSVYPIPPGKFEYPQFVRWLHRIGGTWNIGLAPLRDTPFNRFKSPLKWYDYSALGLTTVASKVEPFSKAIRSGQTGMLVDNTTQDWFACLERLLCDPIFTYHNALGAQHEFLMQHSFSSPMNSTLQAWHDSISRVLASTVHLSP